MIYGIDRLKRDVMARLGEVSSPQSSAGGLAVSGVWEVLGAKVESLLPEIGSKLIREAPMELLGGGENVEVEVNMRKMPCGLYAAELALPDGFVRLVGMRMSEWIRSVNRVILPGMSEWDCQWSAEEGIAGSPDRPRVYLEGRILRGIGSKGEDDTLSVCSGWLVPEDDKEGLFRFPIALYPQLVDTIVGRC
ncbi:MAG: hypothetical protein K2N35_04465 [Muribaculaceae bacterium]|nr:hypothetical protein [Muribaculaceae bacterium]